MILAHGEAGTCRFCRCNGDSCRLSDGDRCGWLDKHMDTCNATACVCELVRRQKETTIELAEMRRQRRLHVDQIKRYHQRNGSRRRGGKKAA